MTPASPQATVYDDEHMGEHVSVISQFQNVATEHTKGGVGLCRPLSHIGLTPCGLPPLLAWRFPPRRLYDPRARCLQRRSFLYPLPTAFPRSPPPSPAHSSEQSPRPMKPLVLCSIATLTLTSPFAPVFKRKELCVCAWVNSDGWQPHPMGDAVLASPSIPTRLLLSEICRLEES